MKAASGTAPGQNPVHNIAAHLPRMARHQPHRLAIVCPSGRDRSGRATYVTRTFAQLDRESDEIAAGLEAIGITRGVRTALMVSPSLELFELVFALFKVQAVPVMIDPGIGLKHLKECLGEASPKAFIGIPKAHIARLLFGWAKKSLEILVTVGPKPWGGVSLDRVRQLGRERGPFEMGDPDPDDPAAILFTSGSTGVPKGALYSHGNFCSQVEFIRELYGIEPGEIDLPTFPLFALFDPALGMTAIIPDMDPTRPGNVDPKRIFEPIENFGVTNMFGSPALLNRVGRAGVDQRVRLPSLRRVLSAGAPVSGDVLRRFSSMMDSEAQIFTPYGATEVLPVASIGSREILDDTWEQAGLGRGVCVGKPLSGLDVRIIGIDDDVIETWDPSRELGRGQIGEIVVKGPNVTGSYFARDESTRLAKIRDPEDGKPWHRMGDLGYLDDRGRLWFCGRKSHRVTGVRGPDTLMTIPCEGIFNRHEKVYRTALVGVGSDQGTRPVLCVELEKEHQDTDRRTLERELRDMAQSHEITRQIETFLFHDSFPVDIRHNAKIFREKLAVWAREQIR